MNEKDYSTTTKELQGWQKSLTEQEVSLIIGRSCSTLQRWRAAGKGPKWYRLEGRIMYAERELYIWQRQQMQADAYA